MIQRHHEHTFDLDLCGEGTWSLDIGCRNFAIPRLISGRGGRVIAVDADPGIIPPQDLLDAGVAYLHRAVVDKHTAASLKAIGLFMSDDPQAHTIIRGDAKRRVVVPTVSVEALRVQFQVNQFSLLKLDCEGAEYKIIRDLAGDVLGKNWASLPRQVSVEYHDHCGHNPSAAMEDWYGHILGMLGRVYTVERHVREVPPWGGPAHYIDDLYQLRREFWV